MINNIQEEKCSCCNGTGKEQIFNDYEWTYANNLNCKYCKGTGKRQYYILINRVAFLKQKVYM